MPPTRDLAEIRAILQTDPRWAVYPLGDLAPAFFARCVWVRSADSAALVLLFCGFDPPILFAVGPPDKVPPLLGELTHDGDVFVHVRPDILSVLAARYDVSRTDAMWRMALDPGAYRPDPTDGAVRLGPGDLAALQRLHADGAETGETPHFFLPSMVEEGVYFGIYEGEELVASAGTHLVVPQEGVAAIGNIYTRRDRRGRGQAGRVTSAVVRELQRLGIPVIALNVNQMNAPAVHIYERLGFTRHCVYHEGLAPRRPVSKGLST
jgi:ribosomal protein S18 acetylase RimI-like enzyme